MNERIEKMKSLAKDHLTKKILPFWESLKDEENGGYYGYMGFDLKIDKEAVKGCILNSRIMWFFANAAVTLNDESIMPYAKHAYDFMKKNCVDYENGGVFWSVKYNGEPEDTTKHTYNQAFSIYALSSYADAVKHFNGDEKEAEEALKLAFDLEKNIETRMKDDKGYLEAFKINFEPESNEKLSENGVMAEKTMNTLLHVFEAYTELYRVTKDAATAEHLRWIFDIFEKKVYNPKLHRQEVFFDKDWNSIIDLHSYGHDIETSWLMDRGCEVLGDAKVTATINPISTDLADKIYNRAYVNHSLLNECEKGVDNTTRIWWVQAETVLGFLNAYRKTNEERYLAAAEDVLNYILTKLTDPRDGSEWYWCLDENDKPVTEKPIVEPWKCPYHNGRMCMEIIKY
ncbi:MAG TPA: N-acylglucosamine 2-epimerase [Lachnospiraceae bacterium]|nr:N-acylglucosamine 2-epimerase [Lachnospiraceae bacterium]HBZ90523.1 N-acylglucosamine 2-epimerase [Lachnospiraceae bacterium]